MADAFDGAIWGERRDIVRGDEFRSEATFGGISAARGRFRGQSWRLTENGFLFLQPVSDAHEAFAPFDVAQHGGKLRLLGRLRSPQDVYVVQEIFPHAFELRYYDSSTFHLVRTESDLIGGPLLITTFSDDRLIEGVGWVSHRLALGDGSGEPDRVIRIREIAKLPGDVDGELAVPEAHPVLASFPDATTSVRLPAHIDQAGAIIATVTVNGHRLKFQLDTGTPDIVLDAGVAKDIGLRIVSPTMGSESLQRDNGKAVIAAFDVGALKMKNVVVSTLSFDHVRPDGDRIVGLLGHDFLAGGTVKIEYGNGTVDMMRPGTSLPGGAQVFAASMKDGVPMIPFTINGRRGENFVVDTGSEDVYVFHRFASLHPEAVEDSSPGKVVSRVSDADLGAFERATGLGPDRMFRLASTQLGPTVFKDVLAKSPRNSTSHSQGEEVDGLIGTSILRSFDVYIDYGTSRVGLVPRQN